MTYHFAYKECIDIPIEDKLFKLLKKSLRGTSKGHDNVCLVLKVLDEPPVQRFNWVFLLIIVATIAPTSRTSQLKNKLKSTLLKITCFLQKEVLLSNYKISFFLYKEYTLQRQDVAFKPVKIIWKTYILLFWCYNFVINKVKQENYAGNYWLHDIRQKYKNIYFETAKPSILKSVYYH